MWYEAYTDFALTVQLFCRCPRLRCRELRDRKGVSGENEVLVIPLER
jgi:hypothetical protein